jgi:hypothetical protein
MQRTGILIGLVLLGTTSFSQRIHIGVFGGASAYQGDLVEGIFPKKVTNAVGGIDLNYELLDNIMIRAGFNYTVVSGADRYSKNDSLIARNLSFETSIFEVNLLGEYYFMNLNEQKFSPYIFGGVAIFHFNPYAFKDSRERIYLKPLSTEGEGLSQYPDRKPYALTQLALPFGGGVKYAINDNWRIGLELGMRKLFTDYLDDVSTTYADRADLLAAKGQLAVDMAYRGNQSYPAKGAQRGGSTQKDWYYFLGLHLTYRLGNGGGVRFMGGNKKGYGCPGNPQ